MLFEITFWSGRKALLRAFDNYGARVLAAEEWPGELVRSIDAA